VYDGASVLSHVMVSKENMKGSRYSRTIKLNTRTRQAITSFLTNGTHLPEHFLFRSRQGSNRPWSTCQAWRIIRGICKDLHIEGNIGTHSLRKTFAMSIYSATNNNIRLTQVALGDRTIQVTINYLLVSSTDVDNAVDMI